MEVLAFITWNFYCSCFRTRCKKCKWHCSASLSLAALSHARLAKECFSHSNLFTLDPPSPEYPQVVNKYFCSFLWCAFSRVSTGTLSWLEGTLQALQRINIRASISRATKMLHTIATTAAVESPVVDTESSQSHSCIADTVKASFRSTGRRRGSDPWPVIDARRDAVNFKGRLVDITVTLSLFFFLWGSSRSSDPAWRRASYFSHLLSSRIDDTPFVERRGRRVCRGCVIWNGCKTQSSFAGWIYFSADCCCRAHARIWFER